ncbi:MAG: hypothetical protein ACQEVQ_02715 [Pseudomonadota bacterium]
MSDTNRTIEDVEKTAYETLSANRFFQSHNKTASALEKLAFELEEANKSSTKLSQGLNRLTLAAVIIASLALILEAIKMFKGW